MVPIMEPGALYYLNNPKGTGTASIFIYSRWKPYSERGNDLLKITQLIHGGAKFKPRPI